MPRQMTLLPGPPDDRPGTPRGDLSVMYRLCDGGRQRVVRVEPGSDKSTATLFVEELITAASSWYRDATYKHALSAKEVEHIKADPTYLDSLAERISAAGRDMRSR